MLLHGLVASSETFGAHFDALAEENTLVVPDLAGFGRSLDEERRQLTPTDHLDALDSMLGELGLEGRPLTIGGHSLGAAIAVRWAARRGGVRRVVAWGPPVYRGPEAVKDDIRRMGAMARLFATESRLARLACHLNCQHRTATGWVAAATHPHLPLPIARSVSVHTWPAYRDALHHLISRTDWRRLSSDLARAGTELQFYWGTDDRIGERSLLRNSPVAITEIPGADHHLPLTHGRLCAAQVVGGE